MSYTIDLSRSVALQYGGSVADANVDAARAVAALAPQTRCRPARDPGLSTLRQHVQSGQRLAPVRARRRLGAASSRVHATPTSPACAPTPAATCISSVAATTRSWSTTATASFLDAWGEGQFSYRTHGMHMGKDDSLYLVDDSNHSVGKYTLDGKQLFKLGPSETPVRHWRLRRHAPPPRSPRPAGRSIDRPTWPWRPDGDLFVSDGYGNTRIHRFDAQRPAVRIVGRAWLGAWRVPRPAQHLGAYRRARLRVRSRKRPHPDLQSRGRVPDRVARRAAAAGHLHRQGRARLRRRAGVARGHDVVPPRADRGRRASAAEHLRHRRQRPAALGRRRRRRSPATSSRRTASGSTIAATSTWPK